MGETTPAERGREPLVGLRLPVTRYGIAMHTAMPYIFMVHAVLETSIFSRRANALLTTDERAEMIMLMATRSHEGDVIPGLGGVRKIRFAPRGRGKSGAFRVIYYVLSDDKPILALLIFAKNEQADLSADQRKVMLKLVEMTKGL